MVQKFSLYDIIPDIGVINVVDVGAMSLGAGTEPYAKLVSAGHAKVVGFEPNEEECEELNRKFGDSHRFVAKFIGDGNKATYFETNFTETGSLYRPNTPLLDKFQNLEEFVRLLNTHDVETHRLDDIEEIRDIDFFKIDVQGAELDVFKNATRVLSETTLVQTEVEFVELYENQPMFADIDQFLRGAGFQFHTFHGIAGRCFKPMIKDKDPNRGFRQFLWADAIYVRDFMNLETVATEKLLKMAAVLHDVMQSLDLCRYVLVHIDAREGSAFAETYANSLMA